MIERIVLLDLKPEYTGVDAVQALSREAHAVIGALPQVRAVSVATAADDRTAGAWDVCIRIRFDTLDDVAAYLPEPAHRALVDAVIGPRVAKLKAFNFAIAQE